MKKNILLKSLLLAAIYSSASLSMRPHVALSKRRKQKTITYTTSILTHIPLPAQSKLQELLTSKLFKAVELNNPLWVEHILNSGADINAIDAQGDTALSRAIYYDFSAIIEILLKRGAHLTITNNSGLNPFLIGIQKNAKKFLIFLKSLSSACPIASQLSQYKEQVIADLLSNTTFGLSNEGVKELVDITLFFLEHDISLDIPELNQQNILFYLAVKASNAALTYYLLNNAINFGTPLDINLCDAQGFTTLHTALVNKDYVILYDLLNLRADVNKATHAGITPLATAYAQGETDVVKLLLLHGAYIK